VSCWEYLRRSDQPALSIQNGALDVSPVEVDEVLLSHPDVDQAMTFPVPDVKFGESVAAAVVLRPGASIRPRDLKWFAFMHLASYKIPQRIFVMDSIPGVARRGLARVLGLRASQGNAAVVPIRIDGAGAPLFVVGAADDFRSALDRPVFGIREPDLAHLPPPHTVEHVAAECVHALRRFQAEGPYALGATDASRGVALEMARQLEQAGERVDFVALFGPDQKGRSKLRYDRRHSWPGRTVYVGFASVQ
jgi:hypothetical protein